MDMPQGCLVRMQKIDGIVRHVNIICKTYPQLVCYLSVSLIHIAKHRFH